MKNKKIIFMGTPSIAAEHLKALIDNDFNVVAVFSQPPRKKSRGMRIQESDVHNLALEKNIEVYCPLVLDSSVFEQINLLKPDIIIVMAYGIILPDRFLNLPKFGCINIHVSLLPRWRGAAPIEHTLLNGDKETGVTIIQIEKRLDAGPILYQEKIKISDEIYKDKLTEKLKELGCNALPKILSLIFQNNVNARIQEESLVTYARKFTSRDKKINFNQSTTKVFNHIRAHGPKPGSWFLYQGERIKIISAKIKEKIGIPSTILNENFEIACNEGSILPTLLQREGKKIVTLDEFLRGYKFSIGHKLDA